MLPFYFICYIICLLVYYGDVLIIMNNTEMINNLIQIPVIPLRGLVVFPDMTLHFDVGRQKSVAALRSAMKNDQKIFLVSQKNASVDDPNFDDVFEIGVVCEIKQMIKIPNYENLRVAVQGCKRGNLVTLSQSKPFLVGAVDVIEETILQNSDEANAYMRAVKKEFEKNASLVAKISNEVISIFIDFGNCEPDVMDELVQYLSKSKLGIKNFSFG